MFISEILYGSSGGSLSDDTPNAASTVLNYALELYNPTEDTISLSAYKIELVTADTTLLDISLTGSILPGSTFVISNPNSSSLVTDRADFLSSAFEYEGYVVLKLVNNGNTIDVIGSLEFAEEVENIDLAALLSDPSYLEQLNINLRSIKDLTVRRRPIVNKGATVFETSELLNQWRVFPNNFVDDLGEHWCVCHNGVVYWQNVDPMTPDKVTLESDAERIAGTVILQGAQPGQTVTVYHYDSFHAYSEPEAGDATRGEDYTYDVFNQTTLQANSQGSASRSVVICDIIDDDIEECNEGRGFLLAILTGPINIQLGFDYIFDILIIDDECTTSSKQKPLISDQLSLYPNVVQDYTVLSSSSTALKIKGVRVIGYNGQVIKGWDYSGDIAEIQLDLSFLHVNGYYILLVNTNQGVAALRFIKH